MLLIPVENPVAGFARYPELAAKLPEGFAVQNTGDEKKTLFHDRTLFPRHQHLPPESEKCYPCVRYVVSPMSQPAQVIAKRLYSIDALRGVGALAIVFWHWQHFWAVRGTWQAVWSRADEPFYAAFKPLYDQGWAAVDIFFAVSGFVFFWLYLEPVAKREIGVVKFALQRFSRLYPLYV